MIQAIRPTSRATLKMQCLFACKGDIDEANKLYDYFAKDMPDLPDYDPIQPTWMDNTKDTVNGMMIWLKENKDTLEKYIDKSNIFEMVYDLALDKLCDDDKKFSIRKYFDV